MALPAFEIEVRRDDKTSAVVVVAGEIDLATASRLASTLRELDGAGKSVHVDLERVTFLDSSGISALVESQKRLAEAGGCLVLHRPSEQIRRVLEISGLGTFFQVSLDVPG